MIRCNNCMATFESEEDLTKTVVVEERDDSGGWSTTHSYPLRCGNLLDETENLRAQVINGCPYCLDDAYLMDITPYEPAA